MPGDVVTVVKLNQEDGWRKKGGVRHKVMDVLAPFGGLAVHDRGGSAAHGEEGGGC